MYVFALQARIENPQDTYLIEKKNLGKFKNARKLFNRAQKNNDWANLREGLTNYNIEQRVSNERFSIKA